MLTQPWLIYALLSAACAAFVGIFAKIGMAGIDSNLATAVRSAVMTLFLLMICSASGIFGKLNTLHPRAFMMIVLSGIAGAASWLFYFKALQAGTVAQVAPIDKLSMPLAILLAVVILGDRPTALNWAGILLISGGAYLAAMPKAS
jgi:bacterial/archaeal transporter family protein